MIIDIVKTVTLCCKQILKYDNSPDSFSYTLGLSFKLTIIRAIVKTDSGG